MEAIKVNLQVRERRMAPPVTATAGAGGARPSLGNGGAVDGMLPGLAVRNALAGARRWQRRAALSLAAFGLMAAGFLLLDRDTMAHTFTEGKVDLKLSNDGGVFTDGVTGTWVSPDNWAPGDELTASLYIRNDGKERITLATVDWVNPGHGDPNLLDKVQVARWRESSGGSAVDRLAQYAPACDANGDGVLSAMELIEYGPIPLEAPAAASGRRGSSSSGNVLAPGGDPYVIEMAFRFMEDAGNEYQGASGSFDLRVSAMGGDHGSDHDSDDGSD